MNQFHEIRAIKSYNRGKCCDQQEIHFSQKKIVKEDNEILSTGKSLEKVLAMSARGCRQHEKFK